MKSLRGITAAALLSLAVLVGLYVGSQVGAQQPVRQAAACGRYQLTVDDKVPTVYLLDTDTGQVWAKFGPNDWVDLKTPPSKK
jgi:hypothetical protein